VEGQNKSRRACQRLPPTPTAREPKPSHACAALSKNCPHLLNQQRVHPQILPHDLRSTQSSAGSAPSRCIGRTQHYFGLYLSFQILQRAISQHVLHYHNLTRCTYCTETAGGEENSCGVQIVEGPSRPRQVLPHARPLVLSDEKLPCRPVCQCAYKTAIGLCIERALGRSAPRPSSAHTHTFVPLIECRTESSNCKTRVCTPAYTQRAGSRFKARICRA
jgi:hypothetical protein